MTVPVLDPADIARTLQVTLGEMPQPLFAVLDGALFDDLPGELLSAGFSCRSLFLEHGDKEVERAGPWLFALDDERALSHGAALAFAQPCAVFWSCAEGEMALWRHLRTLNEVLIPLDAEGQGPLAQTPLGYERAMFRHWDPNVLAGVMPLLDAAQFARVFGPGAYILINAPDYGGLKRIPRPDALPPAPHGPLRLSPDQIAGISSAIVTASHRRNMAYLRRVAPDHSKDMTDAQLASHVSGSIAAGRELGLQSERAHWKWSYLMLVTNGEIASAPQVRSGFANSGYDADRTLDYIMRDTIFRLKNGR